MFCIRIGNIDELGKVKDFYDSLIEEMQEADISQGGKRTSILLWKCSGKPLKKENCI